MATRELLTRSEADLVDALVDLTAEPDAAPRPSFRDGLRARLVAEAAAIEAEEAEAFARVLDGDRAGGELAALAGFAAALVPAEPMRAPAGLRAELRATLTSSAPALAPVIPIARGSVRRTTMARRMSRRLAIAAALAGTLVSSSAFALTASANDTPADSLYEVKRFRERAQTWFISGVDEGVRRLRFADTRVGETETMVQRRITAPEPFEVALDGLQLELTLAADLILGGSGANDPGAQEAIPLLSGFLRDGRERLEALEDDLPPPVRPVASDTLDAFDAATARTEAALEDCFLVCDPDPSTPPIDTPCATCAPDDGGLPRPGGSADPDDGANPGPDPDKSPGGKGKPDPDGEGPLPDPEDPIPTPLPEPDRLPNLPGRLDDELEHLVGDASTGLVQRV